MTAAEFVVDASAAGSLLHNHPARVGYRDWVLARLRRGDRLSAPSLLRYELAAVVFKHWGPALLRKSPDIMVDLVRDASQGIELDEDAWVRCGRLAGGPSAYDACYLALAIERRATLVTFDGKLAKAAAVHVPVLTEHDFSGTPRSAPP